MTSPFLMEINFQMSLCMLELSKAVLILCNCLLSQLNIRCKSYLLDGRKGGMDCILIKNWVPMVGFADGFYS